MLDQVWPKYLQGGYFDSEGNLKPDLVSRGKVRPLAQAMANAFPKLTTNQLRRFFQHCRAIEARLRQARSDELPMIWRTVEADFLKLDSAAADSWGKEPKKISPLFYEFIQCNVAAVKTADQFLRGFLPHFEAVVGFGVEFVKDQRG